jgi:hypothetical protein
MQEKANTSSVLIFCVMALLCTSAFVVIDTKNEKAIEYNLLPAKKMNIISCSPAKQTFTDHAAKFQKNLNCGNESTNENGSSNTNDRNGCSHMLSVSNLQCGSSAHKPRILKEIKGSQL